MISRRDLSLVGPVVGAGACLMSAAITVGLVLLVARCVRAVGLLVAEQPLTEADRLALGVLIAAAFVVAVATVLPVLRGAHR